MSFRRAFKGPFDPKMTPKESFLAPRAIMHQSNTWLTLPTLNAVFPRQWWWGGGGWWRLARAWRVMIGAAVAAFLATALPAAPLAPIHRKPWKSMKIHEDLYKSMKICENLWKSMKIYASLWKSMEIYGNL